MPNFVSAIIAAAGSSTRMGLGFSKQFIMLDNKPVIAHTLSAFENSYLINEIIVVCRTDDIAEIFNIVKKYNITKFKDCVVGGNSRAESVKNAISHLDSKCEYIAIHDGARPLVTSNEIQDTVNGAFKYNACAIGVPVTDTIKVITDDNLIIDTPQRSTLFAVQTPQVFEKGLYLKALKNAENIGANITDDCSLVEAYGSKVYVINGNYTNIKLTTQADIIYAEAILKERG